MKKVLCILVVLSLCILPALVLADFSAKVQTEIRNEIGAFYQRNEGNKITIDVMDGLMLHLNQIFDANVIKPEPKPKPEVSKIPNTRLPPKPKPNLPPSRK